MRVTLKQMVRLAIEDARKEHDELCRSTQRQVDAMWKSLREKEGVLIEKLKKGRLVTALHKAQVALGMETGELNVYHRAAPAEVWLQIGTLKCKQLKYPPELLAEYKAIADLMQQAHRLSCPAYYEAKDVEDAILRATIEGDLSQKDQFALVRATIEELSFPEKAKQITSKEKP